MAQEIYHRSNWGNPTEQWGNVYLNADLTNELYKRASEYENSWVTDQLLNGVGTKPSIILTPTAYEDGVLNSVKPAKTLGSELVPSIATIVNLGGGSITQISGNSYSSTSDGTSPSTLRPKVEFATTIGKTYKLVITPIGTVTGTINFDFYDGSTYLFQNYDFTTTKEITFTDNGNVFGAFDGTQTYSISNFTISIKELTEADFDFTRGSSATRVNELGLVQDVQLLSGELVQNGDFEQIGSELVTNGDFSDGTNDWTFSSECEVINEQARIYSSDGAFQYISQNNILTIGKFYKLTFDVISTNGSALAVNNIALPTETIGNKEIIFKTPFNYLQIKRSSGITDVTIDNVSVKEVGQNWSFGTGWSIEDGVAVCDNSGSGTRNLRQDDILTAGNTYVLEFDLNVTSGGVYLLWDGNTTFLDETKKYTITNTSVGTDLIFRNSISNFIGTIDNISVIEITDDTDLPRINYTNFDYEDVLGDELVTNGSFDTDSDWVKGASWSIANGKASSDGQSNNSFSQNGILTVGKTYKLTLDLTHTSGTLLLLGAYYETQVQFTSSNSYTVFIVPKQNNLTFYASSFIGSIDNISVKEFTEDVVVPYSGEGSLLLEPQSTNLVTYSEDFSQLSTVISGGTVTETANFSEAPNGKNEATRLQMSSASGFALKGYTIPSFNDYFYVSVYLKSNTSENQEVAIYGRNSVNQSYTVTPQWQRFEIACDGSLASSFFYFGVRTSYGSDADLDILAWGVQAEQGTYATSYIPTNGSTVTRLADVCNNSGSSDLINSTEGVLYAEISANENVSGRWISLSNGTTNERVSIAFQADDIRLYIKNTSGLIWDYTYTSANIFNHNKIGLKYKSGDYALWINGTEVSTSSNSNLPSGLNSLQFDSGGGASNFYGNVKSVAVFKEALSDTELQKLTTI